MNKQKNRTEEIVMKVRDLINDSTISKTKIFSRKKIGDWSQFFTALDTIEDTCLAITAFCKDSEILLEKNPYLVVYGILQTLFVQQDAVDFLKISLFGKDKGINWKDKKHLPLWEIRQIRNETIGHPVKTKKKGSDSKYENDEVTSCTIDRSSISREGFSYILWMSSKTHHRSVNFNEVIKLQDFYLSEELKIIMKEIEKEESVHKVKFKGEKLLDILNKPSLYKINLIYGLRWEDHLAWPSFDHYYERYKRIRNGIENRYGKFGETLRIPGTEEIVKKLDYIFSKIDGFKKIQFDNYEFEVYVDALDSGLKELGNHLETIDQEFEV
ncbi:MAG TPA: hypothetical protein VL576_02295 [Candidatus Paceibacterota bacterium]|nr:hypothetical protein [Candidatus Paceibacterota bacterium]